MKKLSWKLLLKNFYYFFGVFFKKKKKKTYIHRCKASRIGSTVPLRIEKNNKKEKIIINHRHFNSFKLSFFIKRINVKFSFDWEGYKFAVCFTFNTEKLNNQMLNRVCSWFSVQPALQIKACVKLQRETQQCVRRY